jgi:hypothetical protein
MPSGYRLDAYNPHPRMLRRAFLQAVGLSVATGLPSAVEARPVPPPEPEPDKRPISLENPRVWPAVTRDAPLPMGAVDAFRAPDRASEMGVQWGRILFDWSVIQRHGPDDWAFGWSSPETARFERDAGRPMIGQFISTPSWASGTSDPKSPPLGLDQPVDDPRNLWAAWVRGVVGRFEGLIDTWVMWNEPDVWSDDNHARQWIGNLEQYYQLLKVGYMAARSANPRARVLLAGMTYWWDAAYGRELYFDRLLRLIAADPSARQNNWYFDAAVLQLYNDPRGLFDAPRIFGDLLRMRGLDHPVWVNETNVVPWDDPAAPLSRAHFRATQDEQASYLIQAMAYALAGGVERVAVFKMLDDSPLVKNVEQAFGMVRADATQSIRPIFRAFQMLRREMTPTSRAQLIDEGSVNRVYLEQPMLGRRMTVIWNATPQVRDALIPALGPTAQVMDRFGQIQPAEVNDDSHIHVTLAGATANTVPGFPDAYFIGGEPVLVLEPLPGDYTPLAPTYSNLPPPGQP